MKCSSLTYGKWGRGLEELNFSIETLSSEDIKYEVLNLDQCIPKHTLRTVMSFIFS